MKKIFLSVIFSLCITQETSSSNPFNHVEHERSCEEFVKAYMIKLQYIKDECEYNDLSRYNYLMKLLEKTHEEDLKRCHEFIQKS